MDTFWLLYVAQVAAKGHIVPRTPGSPLSATMLQTGINFYVCSVTQKSAIDLTLQLSI